MRLFRLLESLHTVISEPVGLLVTSYINVGVKKVCEKMIGEHGGSVQTFYIHRPHRRWSYDEA